MANTYRFISLGPYTVPTAAGRKIDCNNARDVVFASAKADAARRKLGDPTVAVGCYVFGLSPSGRPREWPYYVGQACRQTLFQRTFQIADKPRIYGDIINDYAKARPFIYLLPLLTPSGRYAKLGTNKTMIDDAEKMLIGMALRSNPYLWNVKHRIAMERFVIDGTPQAPRRETTSARKFRTMLGFAVQPSIARSLPGIEKAVENSAEDLSSNNSNNELEPFTEEQT